MRFEPTIAAFEAALSNPSLAAPEFTRGREGKPDAKRFAVYRNNVAVGLIGSLEARFPVTRRLVGDEFFRAMARAFIATHKPRSAMLILYGAEFPDFVAAFEPARDLIYLADVARLENAWVEAYHAAEGAPLGIADLASLAPESLVEMKFAFHPAARLLRLAQPAGSIWEGHQGAGEPRAPEHWAAEDVLITRPAADVFTRVLPEGGFAFALALSQGATLGQAAAPLAERGHDPGPHLVGLIEAGALRQSS